MAPSPPILSAGLGWLFLLAAVAGAGAAWAWRWFKSAPQREGRALLAHIATGRYDRAVPELLEQGRIAEAARLEAWRGNTDQAAALYERAGDMRGAASVYLTLGDLPMAALVLKDAGLPSEAAEAFLAAGRADAAAPLFESAGDLERALDCWNTLDRMDRVVAILGRMGRTQEAARARARLCESEGRWSEAATLLEGLGDCDAAVEAWVRAGEPGHAGRLQLAMGRLEAGAALLIQAGEYDTAADAYARLGQHSEAAHAFYRAGKLDRAVALLTAGKDWVTLARIHLQNNAPERALDLLQKVPPTDPRYEEARVLLVELYARAGRGADAEPVLADIVERRMAKGPHDAELRLWIVRLADALMKRGRHAEAKARLKSLEPLGLMTPELLARLRTVEQPQPPGAEAGLTPLLGLPSHQRYEFIGRIGEGGNGVIYRAVDRMLGRKLAIKMIGQTALSSEMALRFFLREAQTAAQLNHPNIVTIYDMGVIDEHPFIAMELIEGESLADRLYRDPSSIGVRELMPIVDGLSRALDFAHERGVIHRDVKLENVMLTTRDEVKLMDFGLARAIQGAPDRTMIVTGTPLYMSPEQIAGGAIDHRTDIYALGVMVYRIVVGAWPYGEGNIIEHHRSSPVPDPLAFAPGLPRGFREIVNRALAKSPAERFDKASDVARALHLVFD
ncbi:MAG: protein kinase [Deltaproteobacteria bacterium]|nr:protein kinase [Deltaproteobacteria bacterium]MCB9786973.1 protein kinase [Deltaproteobacteria bacterium]